MKLPSIYDFNEWSKIIPPLEFPHDWRIQILPSGRSFIFARFRVSLEGVDGFVSVIFEEGVRDFQWEAALVVDDNVETNPERFAPEETKELLDYIAMKLKRAA